MSLAEIVYESSKYVLFGGIAVLVTVTFPYAVTGWLIVTITYSIYNSLPTCMEFESSSSYSHSRL